MDESTGEVFRGFAIITTVSNSITQLIGHHRSPVIITPGDERSWLNTDAELTAVLAMLSPYPGAEMNAYPVDPAIKSPRAKGIHLIDPIGERLTPEHEYRFHEDITLQGMGATTGRRKRNT